jgi:hypothetical protein
MKRLVALALLACLLAGCAHRGTRQYQPFAVQDGDFGLIAGAALALIENYGPVSTIAVPAAMDRRAVAALKRRRNVVAAASLPPGHIPAATLLMEQFSIDDDGVAWFSGDLGPTGCADGCGKSFSVPYELQGDEWHNASYKVVDYAQHREVAPAASAAH